MTRMKKGRNPFTPNKFFLVKKKESHKEFDKSNIWCFHFQMKGHFTWECYAWKKNEENIHASTVVEGGEASEKKSSKEKDDQKEYFL